VTVERASDDPGPRRAVGHGHVAAGERAGGRHHGDALGPHDHLDATLQGTVGGEPPELAVDDGAVRRAGHDVGGSEELGHPPAGGVVVHLLGRAGLLDPPVAHDDDLVGQRQGLLLVVRHEQGTGAGRPQDGRHVLAQRLPQAGVEAGERLVEQHDLGIGGQGPGQRHALALATGQLVRVRAGALGQADQLEALLGSARGRTAEGHVAGDGQMGEQRTVLEDHAYAAPVGLLPHAGAGDGAAADLDGAGVGHLETGDHTQHRGLARPAGTEQRHQVAVGDLDRGVRHRRGATEALADLVGPDGRRAGHDGTLPAHEARSSVRPPPSVRHAYGHTLGGVSPVVPSEPPCCRASSVAAGPSR
jgi:hypothetical protein